MSREVMIFCDIDGTQNHAPPLVSVLIGLLSKKLQIPKVSQPLKPEGIISRVEASLLHYWHKHRPFTKDSRIGLEMLQQISESDGIDLTMAVLSGRGAVMHEMTREVLEKDGRMELFKGGVFLNFFSSASDFKRSVGEQAIQQGRSVVLFDDDLRAALKFSMLSTLCQEEQTAAVYLIRNISNSPKLLRWAGVQLPNNIHLVNSFSEGARDLAQRIRQGRI